ncbi:nucleoporin FG repeat region protein, partial [Rhizoctonia solani AG-3 Rhs1AP]
MFSFGNNAAKPATSTGFGGPLFGSNTQTTPAATGGLFGASNTTGQQTAPAPTGLFGAQSTAGNTTNGGLFGAQQPAANTTGTTGGLFGAQPANNTGAQGGLFGAPPVANNTTGGLFGAQPGANTGGNAGSSFGFGAPPTTTAPTQPAAQASGPLTRTTKFNDLPDAQKRVFEEIESFIQGRVQISVELKAQKLGEEIQKEQAALDELNKTTNGLKRTKIFQDALIATRIIDGFTKPQQMGSYLTSYANFPLEYFTRQVEEMKDRVQRYKSTIEQIERKLAQALESHSAQPAPSPQAIANALRAQHASLTALAARTAEIDAAVQKHKAVYTTRWRAQTGSARDPFAPASKEDDTLDALMHMSVSVAGR